MKFFQIKNEKLNTIINLDNVSLIEIRPNLISFYFPCQEHFYLTLYVGLDITQHEYEIIQELLANYSIRAI